MRVLMLAPVTTGDAAAAAGLGGRLRDAGHDVTIVADAPYAQLAADAGCAFCPVAADLRELVAASAVGPRHQAPRRLRILLGEDEGDRRRRRCPAHRPHPTRMASPSGSRGDSPRRGRHRRHRQPGLPGQRPAGCQPACPRRRRRRPAHRTGRVRLRASFDAGQAGAGDLTAGERARSGRSRRRAGTPWIRAGRPHRQGLGPGSRRCRGRQRGAG